MSMISLIVYYSLHDIILTQTSAVLRLGIRNVEFEIPILSRFGIHAVQMCMSTEIKILESRRILKCFIAYALDNSSIYKHLSII